MSHALLETIALIVVCLGLLIGTQGCSFKVESEYFGKTGIDNRSITPSFVGLTRGSDRGSIDKAKY